MLVLRVLFAWFLLFNWSATSILLGTIFVLAHGCKYSINKTLHYISLSRSITILIYYVSYRVLEVDIGLICVCLLTLPAFLDKHKPEKLKSFLLCVISYISDKRSSGPVSNNSGPGTPEREGDLARGDSRNLEFGRSLSLPAHPT